MVKTINIHNERAKEQTSTEKENWRFGISFNIDHDNWNKDKLAKVNGLFNRTMDKLGAILDGKED